MVYNPQRKDDISLDLGQFAQEGEKLIISNALDPYGEPIASGIYNGNYFNIHWPESKWKLSGNDTSLEKDFWAFVVMKVD